MGTNARQSQETARLTLQARLHSVSLLQRPEPQGRGGDWADLPRCRQGRHTSLAPGGQGIEKHCVTEPPIKEGPLRRKVNSSLWPRLHTISSKWIPSDVLGPTSGPELGGQNSPGNAWVLWHVCNHRARRQRQADSWGLLALWLSLQYSPPLKEWHQQVFIHVCAFIHVSNTHEPVHVRMRWIPSNGQLETSFWSHLATLHNVDRTMPILSHEPLPLIDSLLFSTCPWLGCLPGLVIRAAASGLCFGTTHFSMHRWFW